MTAASSAFAAAPVELSLRDRRAILDHVLTTLRKRFYRPDRLNADWDAAVDRHRPLIESLENTDAFEQAMSDLLAELGASHLGFFHASARRHALADHCPFGRGLRTLHIAQVRCSGEG